MQVRLLAFAQAAQIAGFRERVVAADPADTPRALWQRAAPQLDLHSLRVAVGQEYHDWDQPIGEAAEIAVIPPVSGG